MMSEMLVEEGRRPTMKICRVNVKKGGYVQARVRKKVEERRMADYARG